MKLKSEERANTMSLNSQSEGARRKARFRKPASFNSSDRRGIRLRAEVDEKGAHGQMREERKKEEASIW